MKNIGNRRYMMSKIKTIIKHGYLYNWYATQKSVKYGYLYNWYVTQGTGNSSITSSDEWSVPLLSDWNYLLSNYAPLSRMKSTNSEYWLPPNNNAVNLFGMEIRAGGLRLHDGTFTYRTAYGLYQVKDYVFSTEYVKVMNFSNVAEAYIAPSNVKYGCSIRLVRPAATPELSLADGTACSNYVGNDGRVYQTLKIGTQVWTAENLAETKYRDGSLISNITDNTAWSNSSNGAMCAYDNNIKYVTYLPIISAAMENEGWDMPYTFNTMKAYLGGDSIAGGKLKENNNTYWINNVGATNDVNFSARGSGLRQSGDGFFIAFQYGFNCWVTYTEVGYPNDGLVFRITNNSTNAGYSWFPKVTGCSIRLVRPATISEQSQVDGSACAPYIGNDLISYPTIKIGSEVFIAWNLAETKFRNGETIPTVTNNTAWLNLITTGKCAVNNDESNVKNG